MDLNWNDEVVEQLDWHWRNQLRPRLDGLRDDEYFWEPVGGCWTAGTSGGGARAQRPSPPERGEFTIDFAIPEPDPPPLTTIAWRLGHVIVGVLGMRVANHFDGPAMDYQNFRYAGTAAEALSQLDEVYAGWCDGVRRLGLDGLVKPCGSAEGPYGDCSMATLVLHINREVLHHGAEIALLRDLYQHHGSGRDDQ